MEVPFHNLLAAHDKMHYKGTRDFPHRRAAAHACCTMINRLFVNRLNHRAELHQRIKNDAFITSHCVPRTRRFHVDWYTWNNKLVNPITTACAHRTRISSRIKIFLSARVSPASRITNLIRFWTVRYITNFLHFFGVKWEIGEKSCRELPTNHQRFEPPSGEDRAQIPTRSGSLGLNKLNLTLSSLRMLND